MNTEENNGSFLPMRPSVGLTDVTDLIADVKIDTNDLAGAASAAFSSPDVKIWKNPLSDCNVDDNNDEDGDDNDGGDRYDDNDDDDSNHQ